MQEFDSLVLVSGGIDSTTLVFYLSKKNLNILCIFFNYGQVSFKAELEALKNVLPSSLLHNLKVIDISFIFEKKNSPILTLKNLWEDRVSREDMYLPSRNLVILSLACCYAKQNGIKSLYTGFIDGDKVIESDASLNYLSNFKNFLDKYEDVSLIYPFINMTKKEIIFLAMELNVPIEKTYSCQISESIPCGACPNCSDKNDALEEIFQELN
jgi:7-cyano-7-deazaguanine synthase